MSETPLQKLKKALKPKFAEVVHNGMILKIANPGNQIFLMKELMDKCEDLAKIRLEQAGISLELRNQPADLREWKEKIREAIPSLIKHVPSFEFFDENNITPEQNEVLKRVGMVKPVSQYDCEANRIKNNVFMQWYYTFALHDSETEERICNSADDYDEISRMMSSEFMEKVAAAIKSLSEKEDGQDEKNGITSASPLSLPENATAQ